MKIEKNIPYANPTKPGKHDEEFKDLVRGDSFQVDTQKEVHKYRIALIQYSSKNKKDWDIKSKKMDEGYRLWIL